MNLQNNFRKVAIMIAGLAVMASFGNVNADSRDGLGPEITIPESSGKTCILPSDQMRRLHPEYLKHDRILTMREGIRASNGKPLDGSLKQCINCHAIKDGDNNYVRIDNDKHFCKSCHNYAAVTIDCFQCHRDIPEGSANPHPVSGSKSLSYRNVIPDAHRLTTEDMAVVAPEVNADERK